MLCQAGEIDAVEALVIHAYHSAHMCLCERAFTRLDRSSQPNNVHVTRAQVIATLSLAA